VCAGQRLQNQERLSSTDRLAWLESQIIQLRTQVQEIAKGNSSMGYALWCQPGGHPFDGNDKRAKRMTTDETDENGKPTGGEITVHICPDHLSVFMKPASSGELN
jgi:hypothetical protein